MNKNTPFYIVSYFSTSDKNSRVGGLRPYFLYKRLLESGYNAKLILPNVSDNDLTIIIKEGKFIKNIKPFLRIFPPDNSIAWSIKVFLYLKKNNRNNSFIVMTTSPPYGLGLVGLLCKKFLKNSIWIADYRDLWTKNTLYNPPLTKKIINPILEDKFHKYADIIVKNTKWDLVAHIEQFPFTKNKSLFMRNGFNEVIENNSHVKYRFIYSGGTYNGLATNEIVLFLNNLKKINPEIICDFYGEHDEYMNNETTINYCGSKSSYEIPMLLTKYRFGLIYLPENSDKGGRVPQKLYDYIGSGVIPIFFNASVEVTEILKELNTGLIIKKDTQISEIIEFIDNYTFNMNSNISEKYSRNSQFDYFIKYIENKLGFKLISE